MEILFATQNKHKLEEANRIVGSEIEFRTPDEFGILEEIPETGLTLEDNAKQKVNYVWDRVGGGMWCVSDDTGLEVEALGGAPGVYSARYAGEGKDAGDNMRKILGELEGLENSARKARFRCVIALKTEGGVELFEGVVNGRLLKEPAGSGGFGYDPIFVPEGYSKTFAELSAEVKNTISHRAIAMSKFADFLRKCG